MQNRTIGIVITAISAFICGCMALFSCIWGGIIASGRPVDVTSGGVTTPQTFPPAIGFTLLCISLLMILVPVAIGFFTLRKKPEVKIEEVPPTS